MKYPHLLSRWRFFIVAGFAAFLIGAPVVSAEETATGADSRIAEPTAEALGAAAAAAGFEHTTMRRIYRTYSDCRSRHALLDACDAKYGRNAWRPEQDEFPDGNEYCERNNIVLRHDDKDGDELGWDDLFQNERCRILGYTHVTLMGKHDPEYVKYYSRVDKDTRFLRCTNDSKLDFCLGVLGRSAWRPERYGDPSGAGTCNLNADILELIYSRGRPLPFRRLFFNERCQRLALSFFTGTSKDPMAHYLFTDLKWGFSIDYPVDWDVIQSGAEEVRLKVASPDGFVCSVIVREAPETRGNDNPAQLFDETYDVRKAVLKEVKRAYDAEMKRLIPGFKVGGFGHFGIAGISMIKADTRLSDSIGGDEGETYLRDVVFWHNGNMYKISCNVDSHEEPMLLTAMYLFMAGLTIKD